jgi:uncharacterized protein (DUF433 family)
MKSSVIRRDGEILSGTPCFVGTRVPGRNLIDCLEGGYSIDQFLADFPTVSRQQVLTFLQETKTGLEIADRQALVRRVMELDEQGLTAEELKLAETRLEAHRKDPSSSLSANEVLSRLRKLIGR